MALAVSFSIRNRRDPLRPARLDFFANGQRARLCSDHLFRGNAGDSLVARRWRTSRRVSTKIINDSLRRNRGAGYFRALFPALQRRPLGLARSLCRRLVFFMQLNSVPRIHFIDLINRAEREIGQSERLEPGRKRDFNDARAVARRIPRSIREWIAIRFLYRIRDVYTRGVDCDGDGDSGRQGQADGRVSVSFGAPILLQTRNQLHLLSAWPNIPAYPPLANTIPLGSRKRAPHTLDPIIRNATATSLRPHVLGNRRDVGIRYSRIPENRGPRARCAIVCGGSGIHVEFGGALGENWMGSVYRCFMWV